MKMKVNVNMKVGQPKARRDGQANATKHWKTPQNWYVHKTVHLHLRHNSPEEQDQHLLLVEHNNPWSTIITVTTKYNDGRDANDDLVMMVMMLVMMMLMTRMMLIWSTMMTMTPMTVTMMTKTMVTTTTMMTTKKLRLN